MRAYVCSRWYRWCRVGLANLRVDLLLQQFFSSKLKQLLIWFTGVRVVLSIVPK